MVGKPLFVCLMKYNNEMQNVRKASICVSHEVQ